MRIGIRDALVFTGSGLTRASVVVEGHSVVSVGDDYAADRVIDAEGWILGPGLVDVHCHTRDPGDTDKEDLRSATLAAAAGGFTAILAMPNTTPPPDSTDRVQNLMARARQVGSVEVATTACVTQGREGQRLTDLASLHGAGVRVFSDDGDPVEDEAVMRKALVATRDLEGAVIAQHAEDRSEGVGHLHDGPWSKRHGVAGITRSAEVAMVERDIALASETGGRLHLQHLSTAESCDLVAAAKESGVAVTAEVTPHHLVLDHSRLESAHPRYKMYPPLREPEDGDALRRALADGVIDVVATDHAPHRPEDKDVPFDQAARGVIGLETALSVVLSVLGERYRALFEVMSVKPAVIAGFARQGVPVSPGAPANLVLFDPVERWRVGSHLSKSDNSPFQGWEMSGKVKMTMYEGAVVYDEVGR